jgi:tRNA(Ile)-lysidine synthase
MRAKMHFKGMEVLRPLLALSKDALEDYARSQHLSWISDKSNADLRFDRNFLRQEIIPQLKTRWPDLDRSLARAGELCGELSDWMDVQAEMHIKQVAYSEDLNQGLSMRQLLLLDTPLRWAVLRYWLQNLGQLLPSHAHMLRIDQEILRSRWEARPRLKLGNYEIRRLKDRVFIIIPD